MAEFIPSVDTATAQFVDPALHAKYSGAGGGSAHEVFVAPSGDTTGATDLANIQAAIDAATEVLPSNDVAYFSQGKVADILLIGKYTINGPIQMKNGVRLRGQGWLATTIHLAPNSNTAMVTAADKTWWYSILDIHFDGHGESQTAGDYCILIDSWGAISPRADSCTIPFIQRVMVEQAWGSGFKLNAIEGRFQNLFAFRSGKYGFHLTSSDMWVNECTAGDSGDAGFYVGGGQSHISDCKSYWSGYLKRDRTSVATKTTPTPNKAGWIVASESNMFVNCDAQDSSGVGWSVSGGGTIMRNCVSDSSTNGGFYVSGAAANCTIDGHIRAIHGDVAPFILKLESWASTRNNRIRIDVADPAYDGRSQFTQGLIDTTGTGAQYNMVRLGNPEQTYTTTYAASITPDPLYGGVDVTLTGDVTIANTVADRSVHGTVIDIMLTQDATGGRAVTFGTDYISATAVNTAAGKVNLWTFRRVKGKWIQTGYTAY